MTASSSSDGLEVNLQKFNGGIYLAEGIMYSKGALQYKIELERYPDLAYHTSTCKDNGEQVQHLNITSPAHLRSLHRRKMLAADRGRLEAEAELLEPRHPDIHAHGVPRPPLLDILPHPALHSAGQDGAPRHSTTRRFRNILRRPVMIHYSLMMLMSNQPRSESGIESQDSIYFKTFSVTEPRDLPV